MAFINYEWKDLNRREKERKEQIAKKCGFQLNFFFLKVICIIIEFLTCTYDSFLVIIKIMCNVGCWLLLTPTERQT